MTVLQKSNSLRLVLFFLAFVLTGPAVAASNTAEGIIDEIRNDDAKIIISDQIYHIGSQIIVNRKNGRDMGIQYLQAGMSISYKYETMTNDFPQVREVWILDRPPVDQSVNDD